MVMSSLFRAPIWALCSELGLQFQPEIHFVSSVGGSEHFVPRNREFFVDSGQLNDRILRLTLYRHPSRLTVPDYVYSRYVRARQEWDERFGDQIKSKNNWRLAAFTSMATTLLCVTGMVAIGYRSNTVPYVVALDDVGRAVPVVPAKQVAVKDVRLQAAVVARWLTDLRTVVTDAVAQRRLVDEVYAETGQNSAASATVTEFYSKNSPFDLLTKQTVDASVESIVQQSSKTYEVTWTEVTRDLVGEFVASHRYRAFVSVTTQEVTDAKQALVNPLGLYVTNLAWGEVVSTSGSSSAVGNDQTTKGGSGK